MADVMKRVHTRPTTASQPSHRHRRASHGAAAVSAAANAPRPATVGTPWCDSGPRSTVTATTDSPSAPTGRQQHRQRCAGHGRAENGQHHPPPTACRREHDTDDEHRQRDEARADDDQVDDPVRQRAEPGEQVGREGDQRVAEQPLDEHDDEQDHGGHDRPQDVRG